MFEPRRSYNPEGVHDVVPPSEGVQDIVDRQTSEILGQTKAERRAVEEAQRIAKNADLAEQRQAADHQTALGGNQNRARGASVQVIPAYHYLQPYIDNE